MFPPYHKCDYHRLIINIYHPAGLCKKMFEQCNGLQQEMKMIRLNDKCQLIQKRGKTICVYIQWLFLYTIQNIIGILIVLIGVWTVQKYE